MSKGYVFAEFVVTDAAAWAAYMAATQASLAGVGARYLGGVAPVVLEGELGGRGLSLLEFSSPEAARAWYESPAYQQAKALRQGAGQVTAVLLTGPD